MPAASEIIDSVTQWVDSTVYPVVRDTLNPILFVIGEHIAAALRTIR